jgi:hypothetical protein
MNHDLNPRSVLHALEPIDLGTPTVESLTSYFCRLAYSHSFSATQLASWLLERHRLPIPNDFKWCQRNFISMDNETSRWAAWLSEMTGVGNLDQLSLVPWKHLIGGPGLTPKSDRWCPLCLKEDRASDCDPYLRLIWDLAPNTACLIHKVELAHQCPHCKRSNVRNRASIVVPGYCTSCGGFLGDAETPSATPEALWIARQLGLMLSNPPPENLNSNLADTLGLVIAKMVGGNVARFATKLELSKSTVWGWVNRGGLPTLHAWLNICRHTGLTLDRHMNSDLEGWVPPIDPPQFSLGLSQSGRKGISSRTLDWVEIDKQLQSILTEDIPITLSETCQRLGIDHKLLYLRANQKARAISARYREYEIHEKERRELLIKNKLSGVLKQRLADGYDGISARDVQNLLAGTELANNRSLFALIKEVREAANDQ